MYPIFIKHQGETPPTENGNCFILARNGCFVRKKMRYWEATVPVPEISTLEPQTPTLTPLFPIIPKKILLEILRLFAWIYHTHGTEAVVLLWINTTTNKYRISVPPQRVSAGRATYDIPRRNPEELLIGTFHSHGSGSAFHSSTDVCDEKSIDGIHGTFGRLGKTGRSRNFELSVQVAINGTRFPLNPEEWIRGIVKVPSKIRVPDPNHTFYLNNQENMLPRSYTPPQEWLEQITPEKSWNVLGLLTPLRTRLQEAKHARKKKGRRKS